jgi:methylenetetrahydrofolate reductase (NADPH)
MTLRSESRLERILHQGFAVTAEVVPPRGADPAPVTEQAEALVGYADAVNITDNPASSAHMSSLAGAALVARAGLEPVAQVTTRDRNRLAITADLLGSWALGARNVLCLTGDPVAGGDHPEATEVYDLDVLELVRFAVGLRDRGELLSGKRIDQAPRFFVGVADVPLAERYDPARLEAKIEAGADFVQTQIAYDADALGEWAEAIRPRGVFERAFVLVGVAPPRSAGTVRFIRDHLPGAGVPDEVVRRMESAGPDAPDEGVRLTVEIVRALRDIRGVSGVHVMGLGHEEGVRRVIEEAGLLPRPEAAGPSSRDWGPVRRTHDERGGSSGGNRENL